MPRKPKPEKPVAKILAPIPADVLDQIVRDGPLTAEDIETASQRFKKALIERALAGELTHHLGYPPGAAKPALTTNHRNGTSDKTVLTDDGPEAATKLIWLALRNITAKWQRGDVHRRTAMNQFAILYGDRFSSPTA